MLLRPYNNVTIQISTLRDVVPRSSLALMLSTSIAPQVHSKWRCTGEYSRNMPHRGDLSRTPVTGVIYDVFRLSSLITVVSLKWLFLSGCSLARHILDPSFEMGKSVIRLPRETGDEPILLKLPCVRPGSYIRESARQ